MRRPLDLPPEIWSFVAAELAHRGTPDAQFALYSLCRLSHNIYYATIEQLYHTPLIDGFRQSARFLRNIQLSIAFAKKTRTNRTVRFLSSRGSLAARQDGGKGHSKQDFSESSAFGNAPFVFSLWRVERVPDDFVSLAIALLPNIVEFPRGFWGAACGTHTSFPEWAAAVEKRVESIGFVALKEENKEWLLGLARRLEGNRSEFRATADDRQEITSPQYATADDGWSGSGSVTKLTDLQGKQGTLRTSPSAVAKTAPSNTSRTLDPSIAGILASLLPTDRRLSVFVSQHIRSLRKLAIDDRCVTASPDAVLEIAVAAHGPTLCEVALLVGTESNAAAAAGRPVLVKSRFSAYAIYTLWNSCPNLTHLCVEGVSFPTDELSAPTQMDELEALTESGPGQRPEHPNLWKHQFGPRPKLCVLTLRSCSFMVRHDPPNGTFVDNCASLRSSLDRMLASAPNLTVLDLSLVMLETPSLDSFSSVRKPPNPTRNTIVLERQQLLHPDELEEYMNILAISFPSTLHTVRLFLCDQNAESPTSRRSQPMSISSPRSSSGEPDMQLSALVASQPIPKRIVDQCPNMHVLQLANVDLSANPIEEWTHSPRWKKLAALDLRGCGVPVTDATVTAVVDHTPLLRHFVMATSSEAAPPPSERDGTPQTLTGRGLAAVGNLRFLNALGIDCRESELRGAGDGALLHVDGWRFGVAETAVRAIVERCSGLRVFVLPASLDAWFRGVGSLGGDEDSLGRARCELYVGRLKRRGCRVWASLQQSGLEHPMLRSEWADM